MFHQKNNDHRPMTKVESEEFYRHKLFMMNREKRRQQQTTHQPTDGQQQTVEKKPTV